MRSGTLAISAAGAALPPSIVEEPRQAFRDDQRDHRRGQFVRARKDPVAGFVVLADDVRAALFGPVVHALLHLRFDGATLPLDDDAVLEAARKLADADCFQPPGHADLVDADADLARVALA